MRIAIYMMQRNEGELLRLWAKYHTGMVGAEYINVIDNDSDDPHTRRILEELEASGIVVIRGISDFSQKGPLISRSIYNNSLNADWCFPLDCDEFLAVDYRGLDNTVDVLRSELSSIPSTKALARINRQAMNIPHTTNGFWFDYRKVAVRGGCDVSLDTGFHLFDFDKKCDLVGSDLIHSTSIVYLHFHNRPFSKTLESAKQKLRQRIKDFSRDSLMTYSGEGNHLIKYFFMSELDYLERAPTPDFNLAPLFESYDLKVPFCERI